MNYARIIENVAVEVFTPPDGLSLAECFHPDIAAAFVQVPAKVQVGWQKVCNGWQAPAGVEVPAEPAPVQPITVTPPEFKLLWTSAERIAIKRIRNSTDQEQADLSDALDDFFEILDDSRLTHVNLSLASTQAGIAQVLTVLHGAGVVDDIEARTAAILSGNLQ